MNAILDGTAATLSSLLRDKRGRKIVCVQGLGFVGAANAIAIASARDGAGNPLYIVIGVDLPPFRAAIGAVGDHMKPDALILLESTVPPGTTERIVAPLLRERLAARSLPARALKLAYCYERVMPGDAYLASIVDMWRVYAGMTVQAADATEVSCRVLSTPESGR